MNSILIAGGTDGIGRAFLEKVRQLGQFDLIYVLGRHPREIEWNSRLIFLQCDITDHEMLQLTLSKIPDQSLCLFVNTIGSFIKRDFTDQQAVDHFEVNAVGNILLTEKILPKMKTDGQIVVCCSSLCDYLGRPQYGLQGATKVAYKYYLDSLRLELGQRGSKIRLMTIHPSGVQTQIFQKGGDGRDLSRYATVDQIAEILWFQFQLPRNLIIKDLYIYNMN